jgi:cyanophycin synthetase
MSSVLRKLRTAIRLSRRMLVDRRDLGGGKLIQFKDQVSYRLWEETAAALGLQCQRRGPILEISDGGQRFRIMGHLIESEHNLGASISGNKALTNQLLRSAGVSVPAGKSFMAGDRDEAVRYGVSLNRPCVVKPARGTSYGQGVTVRITRADGIRKAFKDAEVFCDEILVEEFVSGENYRVLVHAGRCQSVLKRELPRVAGDGVKTIRQLVTEENTSRINNWDWQPGQKLLMQIKVDASVDAVLASQHLRWDSVPQVGQSVELSRVCNYQFGASYTEMLSEANPVIIAACELAAREIGIELCGVDLISPDIHSSQYAINEVNTCPLLAIHYAADPHNDVIRSILQHQFSLTDVQLQTH